MREPGQPSLDQLRVFVAVIDAGGFAHAARQLHRTQSVISYTIANLEEQLNVVLLDRGKRKPTLTDAGKALLADARAVALKVDGMRARAKALASTSTASACVPRAASRSMPRQVLAWTCVSSAGSTSMAMVQPATGICTSCPWLRWSGCARPATGSARPRHRC